MFSWLSRRELIFHYPIWQKLVTLRVKILPDREVRFHPLPNINMIG